jgi:RNA polymerase sigma-70 factor, ECF subfamily
MLAIAMSVAFPASAPQAKLAPLDRASLARLKAQDKAAFRAFVARYQAPVFALLSRILGSPCPDVEDLAQETFVRAFRAFPSFDVDGPAKVSTWLLTIATRLALDLRKKQRVRATEVLEEAGEIASDEAPDHALEQRELGRALARAAAALPDDQRAALVLADAHGLSTAEIAVALEVGEATAKTRLFRARKKMRAALATEWRNP